MKSLILIFTLFVCVTPLFSQSYLGITTKQVNFREGPGSSYEIISSLKVKKQLPKLNSKISKGKFNYK